MSAHRLHIAALLAALSIGSAAAATRAYVLPDETATLAPGPNMDVAQGNCGACHSADYIATQPRGLPNPKAFWTAEVVKMQKVYGAPIQDADVPQIVEYLVGAYGR